MIKYIIRDGFRCRSFRWIWRVDDIDEKVALLYADHLVVSFRLADVENKGTGRLYCNGGALFDGLL